MFFFEKFPSGSRDERESYLGETFFMKNAEVEEKVEFIRNSKVEVSYQLVCHIDLYHSSYYGHVIIPEVKSDVFNKPNYIIKP